MKTFKLNGETLSLTGWANKMGMSRWAMSKRVAKTTTREELITALTTPARQGTRTDLKRVSPQLKKA